MHSFPAQPAAPSGQGQTNKLCFNREVEKQQLEKLPCIFVPVFLRSLGFWQNPPFPERLLEWVEG